MDTDKTPLRRKLIKGSLSAPIVMTVTSATGTARTSFTACLANTALLPRTDEVLLPPRNARQDEWVRVMIDIFEASVPDAGGKLVKQPGRYFVGYDKTTIFRLAQNQPGMLPPVQVMEFNANTLGLQTNVVGRQAALAYVTDKGDVVGFGWEPNGGTHCKKSCYSSVIAQNKA